ncbi:MAG: hypothetical protein JXA11_09530 [Phycisphaerae bacterium]|nr:hypothetical protein [Phycisphaerae bacterium]
MTKRQLIDEILVRNTSADPEFLSRFDDEELDDYLVNLRRLQAPRLTGDASRYEKYFAFNTPAKPVAPAEMTSPCLPAEEGEVDDCFWHFDQEFENEEQDDDFRKRVDRFAEQLIDRMTDQGDLPDEEDFDDDGGGQIVYHRPSPSLDDDLEEPDPDEEEDGALQKTGASFNTNSRDNDSWLF